MAAERVIAIAGAGGNLGPVVVERLARAGIALELAGRDEQKLVEVADRAGAKRAGTFAVDLTDESATRAWADAVSQRRGRIDGFVHMVGGWRGGKPIEEQPAEDWAFLERLLVQTLQNATRAFTQLLIGSRGRFVLVSTAQAQSPTSTNATYAAAKAACEAWTLALADRFRGTGATANVVVVGGAIVTPGMRAEKPGDPFTGSTPAEAVAEAIAYLSSGAAATMNGQRLVLRGAG
jgi:NAD(P)-dependent dehydrogenase (short-subunit alcohol dehydrogenase family)